MADEAGVGLHLVDGAQRLADLELQIPQQVEQSLSDLLAPRRAAVADQQHEIDVNLDRRGFRRR